MTIDIAPTPIQHLKINTQDRLSTNNLIICAEEYSSVTSILQTRSACRSPSSKTLFPTRASYAETSQYKLDNHQCQQAEARVLHLFPCFKSSSQVTWSLTIISHSHCTKIKTLHSLKREKMMSKGERKMGLTVTCFWLRQMREEWRRDLPPVRKGPIVRRLHSQSVAAAHSEFHTWCHSDDPRAAETLWNLRHFPFIQLVDPCLLKGLIYWSLMIGKWVYSFCGGESFVSVDFLSSCSNDLSVVFQTTWKSCLHPKTSIFICWELFFVFHEESDLISQFWHIMTHIMLNWDNISTSSVTSSVYLVSMRKCPWSPTKIR